MHQNEDVHFMGILYGAGDRESYGFPIGMQLRKLQCIKCRQDTPCDGFDNNCDGQIDEQICQAGDISTTAAGDCCSPGMIGNNIGITAGTTKNISANTFTPKPPVFTVPPVVSTTTITPEPPQPPPTPTAPAATLGQCYASQQAVACFNSKLAISCPIGKSIKILDAHFGRIGYLGETTCNSPNPTDNRGIEVNCGYDDIYSPVASICEGQGRCEFSVNRNLLGDACVTRSCPLCILYAIVDFICIDSGVQQCSTLAGRTPSLANPNRYTASSWLNSQQSFACGGSESGGMTSCGAMAAQGQSWAMESRGDLRQSRLDMTSPYSARFASNNVQAWCPQHCDRNNSFLQMDMAGNYQIQGFVLQGRRFQDHFVHYLGLQYSSDGKSWTELRDANTGSISTPATSKPIVFPGPRDGRTVVYCDLSLYRITARFVRAIAVNSIGYPCIHFDVMRCDNVQGCQPKSLAHTNMLNEIGVRNTKFTVKCDPGKIKQKGFVSLFLYYYL